MSAIWTLAVAAGELSCLVATARNHLGGDPADDQTVTDDVLAQVVVALH